MIGHVASGVGSWVGKERVFEVALNEQKAGQLAPRCALRNWSAAVPWFSCAGTEPGLATFVRVVWQRVADDRAARSAEPRTELFLHDGRTFLALQGPARRPSEGPRGL